MTEILEIVEGKKEKKGDGGVNPGPLTGLTRAGTAQPVSWAEHGAAHQHA